MRRHGALGEPHFDGTGRLRDEAAESLGVGRLDGNRRQAEHDAVHTLVAALSPACDDSGLDSRDRVDLEAADALHVDLAAAPGVVHPGAGLTAVHTEHRGHGNASVGVPRRRRNHVPARRYR